MKTRRTWLIPILFVALSALALVVLAPDRAREVPLPVPRPETESIKTAGTEKPDDWFFRQRAYPNDHIPQTARQRGFAQAAELKAFTAGRDARLRNSWQPAGPTNVGGRITALGIHPSLPTRIFAGAADGGILRSTDNGVSWTPLTDDWPSLSIGAIAMDPIDPDIIYVGTGEANAAGDTYAGTGIYRSTDAGETWEWLGLPLSYKIGRIVINPQDTQNIYVAVTGALYTNNPERGIYRTYDGGATWERCLYIDDVTGAIDVAINPENPRILYAAMWERYRRPHERRVGGYGSGIYRSTDGGDSWTELTNGLPASSPSVGRIGLALCASQPDVIYAIYADDPGYFMGLYKTTNGGDSWAQTNDSYIDDVFSSFGWYFGQVRVAPSNPDHVYALGVPFYRSTNGGNSWQEKSGIMHVDHHALWINPDNPSRLVNGNDGGAYTSANTADSWTKCYDLPISQFYAITIDALAPQRLYGGTQDNSTLRTLTGALDDWDILLGGDGFYTNVDFTDNNIIYAEYQNGYLYKSTDCGYSWDWATDGISGGDRKNWCTPVVMDTHDPEVLYYGSNRVYRTTNGADYWTAISGDLTNGSGGGNLTYGTVTTICPSPADPDYVYAGTDDGNVWMTPNLGTVWFQIDAGLPDHWVTRVTADPAVPEIAYVTLSGYREDEFLPHVFRTTDAGQSWTDISGNLPEVPVNDIVVDPADTDILFVGTDAGVYVSFSTGTTWLPLGTGLPNSAVHDLALDPGSRMLVAGTHGRSMFRYDLDQLSDVDVAGGVELPGLEVGPNPFAPERGPVTVRFAAPASGTSRLSVLDLQGRLIQTLPPTRPGVAQWDGRDRAGRPVAAGTYWLRLEAGARIATSRLVVIS